MMRQVCTKLKAHGNEFGSIFLSSFPLPEARYSEADLGLLQHPRWNALR